MTLFLDCEFTGLDSPNPKLLSIGLVTNSALHAKKGTSSEFYAELAGKAPFSGADTFVLDMVKSQFGLVPVQVARVTDIGRRLGAWLLELAAVGNSELTICYDYDADYELFQEALRSVAMWTKLSGVVKPVHVGHLYGSDEVEQAMEASWMQSFISDGIERHHALADARALRAAFTVVHL